MMAGVIAAGIGSVAFALAAVLQSMAAEWTARREAAEQRAAAPAHSGGTATATTTKAAKRRIRVCGPRSAP